MRRTRYTFSHRSGDKYYWYATRDTDSRTEQISCPVAWFWGVPLLAEVSLNAIFELECGSTQVGCRTSDPGRKWDAGHRNGHLYCFKHKKWELLVKVEDLRPGLRA